MTVSMGLVLPEGLLEGRGAWGSCLTCAPWGRDTNAHLPGEKGQQGHHPTTVRFGDKHLQGWTRAKGWLNPSLYLNVPFCQWSRRILQGYLQMRGFDVPGATETCAHRLLGSPVLLLLPAPQSSSCLLISCNRESVLKPLQRGLFPPAPPQALATFPVRLIRALSINQAEMKGSWGSSTTPWKGMKGPL